MSAAAAFSSSRSARRVPGIGATSSPWCSSHASASCAGVQPTSAAISRARSTRSRLRSRLSCWKRGELRRKSSSALMSTDPVSSPRPSGLYGTMPTPSSRAAGTISRSSSRVNSDHSLWSAAIGWTALAAAQRVRVDLAQAEVRDLARPDQLGHGADALLDRDVRVAAVHVVEVDPLDAEAAQGAFDASRIHSGLLSIRRVPFSRLIANLVASWTSPRRPAIALPTSCSLCPSRTCRRCRGRSRRRRAPGGWSRSTRPRRWARRTRTSPCSRARWRTRSGLVAVAVHGEDSSQPDARYAHLSMRIAPEVAEAVAGGRPVVALESTLISHGLPRPRNLDVARELEAECARRARCRRRSPSSRGGARRAGRGRARRDRRRGRGQVRRARPGGRGGAAASTVRRPWRPRRTWPRARASGCSRPAGWAACTARRARPGTSRPTWRRSRAWARSWSARG